MLERKNGYTYEEVRFILNSYRQHLSPGEIRNSLRNELDSVRTTGAIVAVHNLFKHYKLSDNTYISPSMSGFFERYIEEEKDVEDDEVELETEKVFSRHSTEIHLDLVACYKNLSTLIAEYTEAIKKETETELKAQMGEQIDSEELAELRKYKEKYLKAEKVFSDE